uniref:sugar glycosyltransferase n=1 Tax=Scandinavium goeteborgense TaxID=1851514 RepID=UPI002158656F|nr:sugar glycosyltransferase [Scandinavium goeteborgense]
MKIFVALLPQNIKPWKKLFRVIMGTLTKQIYRYTHNRNMRHNENLWPYVKINRSKFGDIIELFYKKRKVELVDLSSLANSFSGSILLTATGPSVKETDFTQRPNDTMSAGVNGAWHLQSQLNFNFYFIVDMTFIDHHKSILKEICASEKIVLFTTVMGIVKIIELLDEQKITCRIAIIEDICYQTYKPSLKPIDIKRNCSDYPKITFSQSHPDIAFSNDIRKGVFDAGTVIYWALQTICFMGFDNIYIAGLDLNNFSRPRFYEDLENMRPSYLQNKLDEMVFPALQLASEVLGRENISVINLSPQSSVPESTFKIQGF